MAYSSLGLFQRPCNLPWRTALLLEETPLAMSGADPGNTFPPSSRANGSSMYYRLQLSSGLSQLVLPELWQSAPVASCGPSRWSDSLFCFSFSGCAAHWFEPRSVNSAETSEDLLNAEPLIWLLLVMKNRNLFLLLSSYFEPARNEVISHQL